MGEFSDGEDDWVFEMDEDVRDNSEDDDDDLIRSIDEDEVLNQTGRGEKRKSDDQDEEPQQDYYEMETVRKHHSKKFGMTATDHTVRFNNVLHDVDLLKPRTYPCNFPSLNRGCNLGHEPDRSGTLRTTFRPTPDTYIHTFSSRRETYHRKSSFSH